MVLSNKIVNGLWIGSSLRPVEQLTIKSFINNGHTFILWTYEVVTNVPEGTIVKDANEIIPNDLVFCYNHYNQFGHGKGSYAGFSDLFRFKLLYEYGGWWVDMDVTCLRPFNFENKYVFRHHHKNGLVGNIMKCPPKSNLMLYCYNQADNNINADNTDWMLPLKILKSGIEMFELSKYILDISNRDSWPVVARLLKAKPEYPNQWYAVHWMNEEWRRSKIPKDYLLTESYIMELMDKNKVKISNLNAFGRLVYLFKIGKINYSLINLPFQLKGAIKKLFRKKA